MRIQFVTDARGKKIAVILPIKAFNKMVEDLAYLEDVKLYDAAKKVKQKFLNAEDAFLEIEKNQ